MYLIKESLSLLHVLYITHMQYNYTTLVVCTTAILAKKRWPPLQPPVSFPSKDDEYESGDQDGEGDLLTSTSRFDPPPSHDEDDPPSSHTDYTPPHQSEHTEL